MPGYLGMRSSSQSGSLLMMTIDGLNIGATFNRIKQVNHAAALQTKHLPYMIINKKRS
jgi:hypothetical protein